MGISDTLPSTWAGSQGTLGEGTAGTSCLEGAGPPEPPPGLSESKGAISSPLSGYREKDTQHKGSASVVWAATPGMLFLKNRDSSLHPLVSTNGHSATRVVHMAPSTPGLLSSTTPQTLCAFFVLAAESQELSLPCRTCPGCLATTAAWLCTA